ncbi:TetR/AcrR family transcriptional regulator [Pseudemcibacter aquimaris]|uniref:TetR/AcrR family transcriptional regulator n=1 Tax=Pseudemcibacter aquimaris TaxID=2857064 RepID=UPI002010D7B9|nr:TetR/AcrR family transcriptional regulator [Pseudemcibacter aquimaris]MCC3862170.1 TetR/AcrR family transcriptional regulator [Pseudemcibacter aquimaris]WDU58923.1 TetR/AcrR family transcriptional regulator [Pseudemcibacter aquimaris]
MRQKIGKEKILDTALKLFAVNGYHKTSINQIAIDAGVSKGLTYNYFRSKEELLLAIINRATDQMMIVADDMTADESFEETLKTSLDQFIAFLTENKEYLTFQLSLLFQPDLKEIVKEPLTRRAEELLKQTVIMFEKAGINDAKLIARGFLAELDGIALHELSVFENYPLEEMKNQLFERYKGTGK